MNDYNKKDSIHSRSDPSEKRIEGALNSSIRDLVNDMKESKKQCRSVLIDKVENSGGTSMPLRKQINIPISEKEKTDNHRQKKTTLHRASDYTNRWKNKKIT